MLDVYARLESGRIVRLFTWPGTKRREALEAADRFVARCRLRVAALDVVRATNV